MEKKLPVPIATAAIQGAVTLIQGFFMNKDKRTGLKSVDVDKAVQNTGNAAILMLGIDMLPTNERAAYILIGIGGLSLLISQLQFILTKQQ